MREEDRRRVGVLVRQHRERRGLSQVALAQLAGVSDRYLMDLELGRVDPRIGDLAKLEAVLGVELVALAGGSMEVEGDATNRRDFLTLLAATGAGMVDVERLMSGSVDSAWLEAGEAVTMALAGQREAVPPAHLLPAVLGHLDSLSARLPATTELTAKTALTAGVLLQLDEQPGRAFQFHTLACAFGDSTVRAKATGGLARSWEIAGDLTRALTLQTQAVAILGRGRSRLRAGLLARRAELRAKSGDDYGALADLEAGDSAMVGAYEWHHFNPTTADELAAYRGSVLATLGRHGEAVEAFDWTLAHMDPDKVLWRAHVAEDRDRALAAL